MLQHHYCKKYSLWVACLPSSRFVNSNKIINNMSKYFKYSNLNCKFLCKVCYSKNYKKVFERLSSLSIFMGLVCHMLLLVILYETLVIVIHFHGTCMPYVVVSDSVRLTVLFDVTL